MKYVSQLDENDCGVAVMKMIFSYFGFDIATTEIRKIIKLGSDGASISGLCKVANEFGLHTKVCEFDQEWYEKNLKFIPYPFVAYVEREDATHYCVVTKGEKNRVTVYDPDPTHGKFKVHTDNFFEYFTGIGIFFENNPGVEVDDDKREIKFKSYLFKMILDNKHVICLVLLLSFVSAVIPVIASILIQVLMDDVVFNSTIVQIILFASYLAILYIFHALLLFCRGTYLIHLSQRLNVGLTMTFIKKLLEDVDLSYFKSKKVGDIIERYSDSSTVVNFLINKLLLVLVDLIVLSWVSMYLLVTNPSMMLVVAAFIPLYAVSIILMRKRFDNLAYKIAQVEEKVTSSVLLAVSSITTIRSLGITKSVVNMIDDDFVNFLSLNYRFLNGEMRQSISQKILSRGLEIVVISVAALEVAAGRQTVGGVLAMFALLSSFTNPLEEVLSIQADLASVGVSMRRMNEVIQTEPRLEGLNGFEFDGGFDIAVQNVTYSYIYGRKVIDEYSVEISENSKMVLIGKSGSGKSTLARLLCGLSVPESGCVTIGGVAVQDIPQGELHNWVIYVSQDDEFIHGTVAEFLTFGLDTVAFSDIENAIATVNLTSTLNSKGDGRGLRTRVNELSGGERQRLVIARALLRNSKIMIFDEATSALDSETERIVVGNLVKLSKKTILFISHSEQVKNIVSNHVLIDGMGGVG